MAPFPTLELDPWLERANAVKQAGDVRLPELKYWNYTACAAHDEPKADCEYRACGGDPFAHQRVGITWLYFKKSGLLADLPGLGKTNQVLGLAAFLKERGELNRRMVIVVQTPSVLQWLAEAQRWVPKMRTEAVFSGLTKSQRIQRYITDWDIFIIGYHMLLQDWKLIEKLDPGVLVTDDVDPLLNPETQTHKRIVSLAQNTDRCVVMNATSIQTKLQQIHAALMPCGAMDVFGPLASFERRYVRKETYREVTKSGRVVTKSEDVGYKNGDELKAKLAPLFLRRTYEDVGSDLKMPTLMPPEHVWFDLHPAQRARYDELKQGVVRLKRDGVEQVKHAQARVLVNYGQQICAGLPALGEEDTKEGSVKLDWLMKQLLDPWTDRKVVVFIKNIGMVKAADARMQAAGIGTAKIWGPESSAKHRAMEIKRFWTDPNCRVLLGTQAVERSLNLQNANILVNFDTILNPARMTQIAGRIRRAGSSHSHIWVFNLFCRDTQEERYLNVLRRRQAVADFTWEEQSELYEALSPLEMLNLISP